MKLTIQKLLAGKHVSPASTLKLTIQGLLAAVLLLSACTKYTETQLNKGDGPLQLSATKSTVTLNQKDDAADAIVFNWTAGTNKGSNAAISYVLMLDKQGNHFSKAVSTDMGKATLSKKYSVTEFNTLLLKELGFTADSTAFLEAKVVATVANGNIPSDTTPLLTVQVTPYKAVTATLFLIGDATPNGWAADKATPLTADANEPGRFNWSGNLAAGEFKFITTLGAFSPSYNKGADAAHLFYRTADNQPDDKFVISASGLYNISLSLLDMTIDISASELPPYSKLWMLGDAVPSGWDIQNPSPMRVDSSNQWVFTYNEILKAGEFKIPVATGNFATDYYMPLTNHPAITVTTAQLVRNGGPDYKWQITTPGAYKVKLDLQKNTIGIVPFTPYKKIWMVGDATPVGWNIDSPQEMTADAGNPYVFTYSGAMNVGEFKLPLATGNWGCDYFMPVLNGTGAYGKEMKFVPSGGPDYKWKITQAGNYKIVINQLYETISIQKI